MQADKLTRFEIAKEIQNDAIAILPIGSLEQHGPHLPLGTDVFLASYLSEKIAERIKSIIFPPIHFGYSWVWKGLPGTVTISQDLFIKYLKEVISCIATMGFSKILVVNGHDSNKMAIKYALREIYDEKGLDNVYNIFYPNIQGIYSQYMESPTWNGMFHADEFETSLMLSYDESLVQIDKAIAEYPVTYKTYGLDSSSLKDMSKSGIYGDASLATKAKGDAMITAFVDEVFDRLFH